MQHRQGERGITLLLSDRRQDADAAVFDLDSHGLGSALAVAKLHRMQPADLHLVRFVGDRMLAVSRQPIDAASDKEMSAEFMGGAEELVDVALAIADMDASGGVAKQRHGLAHVLQPAEALLLFDGNPRRIDLLFKSGCPLEPLPRPELDGRKTQRKPLQRDGQARMHQKPADGVHLATAVLILAAVEQMHDTDLIGMLSLRGKLRCVLENQDGAGRSGETAARRSKMTGENLLLADPVIRKEAISRLRVGPIPARQRNAFSPGALHPFQQPTHPLAQTLIRERTIRKLAIKPGISRSVHGTVPPRFGARKESCAIQEAQHVKPRAPSGKDVGN